MATPLLARHPGRACAVLIALHAALLCWSARTNSVTFDEFAHLPAGAAYWRHADFSIFNLSPPLLRLAAAALPVASGADAPPTTEADNLPPKDRHWVYGREFLRANWTGYHTIFLLGRLSLVPISCLGAYLVFRWARTLHGPAAGVGACALYCLSPNVLAHAPLVTTDAGTMVVMAAAIYAWWRYCRDGRPRHLAIAAAAIAAAQLCKFTALLLWPTILVVAAWELYQAGPRLWRRPVVGFLVSAAASLLAVNSCYLFQGAGTPLADYAFRSATMTRAQSLTGRLPVPLPRDYVEGFDAQKFEAEGTHQGFVLGEVYDGSRWYFYPVALAAKTPVGVLGLAAVAFFALLRRSPRLSGGEIACLLSASVLIMGMVGLAQLNIGVRYLLPAYPLAYVILSRVFATPSARVARVGTALVAVAALEVAFVAPQFLSFVNLPAGGPAGGWRVVNDSNFDWGQDLLRLRQWMTDNHVDSVHLGYFGRVDPAAYGINYTPLNKPSDSAYVVVSTYYLAGLAHRLPSADGPGPFTHIPFHAALAAKPPRAVVGRTLYVFDRQTVADAMTGDRQP